MSFVLRAALPEDLPALYQMAKNTGGGLTNLPADRPTLKTKLARAEASFARAGDAPGDDLFLFVLEDLANGRVCGTCQIFAKIGSTWPFYSYRITSFSQYSQELDRTIRAEMLVLSTDLDGASEVGGLFLMPGERSTGAGALLARSRYLFMKMHRERFADRTIAELRGAQDETGGSPFWDGVAGRFFGMGFREADEFNAIHGNQFIADLMPKHPIYTAMLPESARTVIGLPHPSGRAAMRMLETEGFTHEGYIDIFDGGPTMVAPTDRIRAVREARELRVAGIEESAGGETGLGATGRLVDFRAAYVTIAGTEAVTVDPAGAALLGLAEGDPLLFTAR